MNLLTNEIHNKPKRPVKILQIGEGNFLRAFIDYFIQVLNRDTDFDGSICMVQPRNSHKIGRFNDQDCLYTVITEGINAGQTVSYSDVIDVIDNVLDPYEEYERFLSYAESEELQVVFSNTTESGIALDTTDTDLSKTPNSYPGKLLALLKARYDHFGGATRGAGDRGLHILPCELITNNGNTLRSILVELARLNNLSEDFIQWMTTANKFYNTLVDRIVPGFPKDDIDRWQQKWGYADNLCVKGEVYHLWCIQGDSEILDVLPLNKTDLNVIVCDDISPYKERKVKILNGSHTFLVSIAYQLGFRIVNKTVADKGICELLDHYLYDEVFPTIDLPHQEKEDFKKAVIDRFANPTIQHEWTSIMLNSMSKIKERILPTVKWHLDALDSDNSQGAKFPRFGLFGIAALFSMYDLHNDDGSQLVSDEPEFIEMWSSLYDGSHSNKEIAREALALDYWDFDFNKHADAIDFVIESFNHIREDGMQAAVEWLTAQAN